MIKIQDGPNDRDCLDYNKLVLYRNALNGRKTQTLLFQKNSTSGREKLSPIRRIEKEDLGMVLLEIPEKPFA